MDLLELNPGHMYASILLHMVVELQHFEPKFRVVGLHRHGLVLHLVEKVEPPLPLFLHHFLELVDLLLALRELGFIVLDLGK